MMTTDPTNKANIDSGVVTSAATDNESSTNVLSPQGTLPSCRVPNDVVGTENTTTFIDGGTKTCAEPMVQGLPAVPIMSYNLTMQDQTLVDFFAKPHIIGSFDFVTADQANDELATYVLPQEVFSTSTVLPTRLNYFQAFRGDIILRVNANPSMNQSGKVLFTFEPFWSLFSDPGVVDQYVGRETHLMSVTQLPKVEFDLGTDRTAEIRIPYRVPNAFFPVNPPDWLDYGRLRVVCYTPLRDSAPTGAVNFQVWAWFDPKTVVLANPTHAVYVPPSVALDDRPVLKGLPKKLVQKSAVIRDFKNSGKSVMDAVSAVERSEKPVSAILNAVSTVSSSIAKVPIIGDIAGPVSWATGLASDAASMLGFSNPRSELPPSFMIDRSARDLNATDMAVPGYVYAFTGAAKVERVPPGGLTPEDEMHFGHLLPMSTYYKTVEWSTSDASGHKILNNNEVGAKLGYAEVASGADYYYHYAPWAAIQQMFAYWHGNLRLTIKIAKTRFHTGRLLVAFDPVYGAIDMDDTDPLNRMVIDIESGNEWTFEFPFPFRNTYAPKVDYVGAVHVYVLTGLHAAGIASSTIDIVFETSMRPDATFAYSLGKACVFYNTETPPASLAKLKKSGKKFQLKGLWSIKSSEDKAIQLTNNSVTPYTDPVAFESTCIGDACRTFRSYLKRPIQISVADEAVLIHVNNPQVTYSPLIRTISDWYALCRGSIRYSINASENTYLRLNTTTKDPVEDAAFNTGYVQYLPKDVLVDVEVPSSSVNPWRYSTEAKPTQGEGVFLYPVLDTANANDFVIFESTADDFDFCYFIGVDPVFDEDPMARPKA